MPVELPSQPRRSKRALVADHLRLQIAEGVFPSGSQLPSVRQLADRWSTPVPAVHQALTELAQEGLIERVPRIGTFVREPRAVLKAVGIYSPTAHVKTSAAQFRHALMHALEERLSRVGITSTQWHDPNKGIADSVTWTAVQQAAATRSIQGLIIPHPDMPLVAASDQLNVPVSVLSAGSDFPGGVRLIHREFLEKGVAALAAAGCRRVGLITTVAEQTKPTPDRVDPLPFFASMAAAAGLQTDPGWLHALPRHGDLSETESAQYGHDRFMALWDAQPTRPDGLLVFSDVAARGVLLAIAQRQVPVPDALRLVLHRNVGVGLLCPVPATFLDCDVAEIADALVSQLSLRFAGQPAPARQVLHHLRFS